MSVIVVDFLTKAWTVAEIPVMSSHIYPYGGIGVFQNIFGIEFSLIHTINRGAAWGILSNYQGALLIFRIVLIVGTFIYLKFFNTRRQWELPFALIIAGALGNVIDFFVYGHVIDMFHFVLWGYDYPVFNVADSTIFIGICWLFLLSWKDKRQKVLT